MNQKIYNVVGVFWVTGSVLRKERKDTNNLMLSKKTYDCGIIGFLMIWKLDSTLIASRDLQLLSKIINLRYIFISFLDINNCIMATLSTRHFSYRRFYFLIISLVGVIGSLICLGSILYQTLNYKILTDDEFLHTSDNFYKFDNCKYDDGNWAPDTVEAEPLLSTDANIEQCKKDVEENILLSRRVDYKQDLVWFLAWGLIFLILMWTHLPMFFKHTKE